MTTDEPTASAPPLFGEQQDTTTRDAGASSIPDARATPCRPLPEGLVRALEEHGVGVKAALTLRVVERVTAQLFESAAVTNDELVPQKPRIASLAALVIWDIVQLAWTQQRPTKQTKEALALASQVSGLAYIWGRTGTFARGMPEAYDVYFTLSSVLRLLRCQYTKNASLVTIAERDTKMAVVRVVAQCAEHYQEGIRTGNHDLEQRVTNLTETLVFEAVSRIPPRNLLIAALASTSDANRPKQRQGRNEALAKLFQGLEWKVTAKNIADMLDDNSDELEDQGPLIGGATSIIQRHSAAYRAAHQRGDEQAANSIAWNALSQICAEADWPPGPHSLRQALKGWSEGESVRVKTIRNVLRTLGILVKDSTVRGALRDFQPGSIGDDPKVSCVRNASSTAARRRISRHRSDSKRST